MQRQARRRGLWVPKIYWDDTNKVFTTTASGNVLVGAATAAAINPSAEGRVLLDGAVR